MSVNDYGNLPAGLRRRRERRGQDPARAGGPARTAASALRFDIRHVVVRDPSQACERRGCRSRTDAHAAIDDPKVADRRRADGRHDDRRHADRAGAEARQAGRHRQQKPAGRRAGRSCSRWRESTTPASPSRPVAAAASRSSTPSRAAWSPTASTRSSASSTAPATSSSPA